MGKFSTFCCESFHRDTDRRVVVKFREIWTTGNRWSRALFTWQQKKNKISPGCPALTTALIALKNLPGPEEVWTPSKRALKCFRYSATA